MSLTERTPVKLLVGTGNTTALQVEHPMNFVSLFTMALQEKVDKHSHYIARENWYDLPNEQIQSHSLEFDLSDMSQLCNIASLLLPLVSCEQILDQLKPPLFKDILVNARDALQAFSEWLRLARELYARHKGSSKEQAFHDNQHEGFRYAPPEILLKYCQ